MIELATQRHMRVEFRALLQSQNIHLLSSCDEDHWWELALIIKWKWCWPQDHLAGRRSGRIDGHGLCPGWLPLHGRCHSCHGRLTFDIWAGACMLPWLAVAWRRSGSMVHVDCTATIQPEVSPRRWTREVGIVYKRKEGVDTEDT